MSYFASIAARSSQPVESGVPAKNAMKGQTGTELLELALALPIFLLLFFGAVQFSIVLMTYCNATYASRNVARYASQHSNTSIAPATTSQLQGLVTSQLFLASGITPTVTVTCLTSNGSAGSNTIGNSVTIKVVWSQTLTIPFAPTFNFSVGSQARRLIER